MNIKKLLTAVFVVAFVLVFACGCGCTGRITPSAKPTATIPMVTPGLSPESTLMPSPGNQVSPIPEMSPELSPDASSSPAA